MSGLRVLAALLLAWCALAPSNLHVESRPEVRFIQPQEATP